MDLPDAPERVALCIGLPHAPEAPGLARREVVGTFGHRLPARILEDLLVVVSELIANAVRHGRSGIGPGLSLALEFDARTMRVTAMDGGARRRRRVDDGGVGGWGLAMVASLADRWGFAPGRPTVAWAEFDLVSSPCDSNRGPGARRARNAPPTR